GGLERGGRRATEALQQRAPTALRPGLRHLPRLGQILGVRLHVGPARVGEREDPASVGVLRGDEPLVLELLQHRIHRSGAGPPPPAAAFRQLSHDRVAVARLLGEQGEHRRADVAAPAAPPARAEPGTEPEARAAPRPRAGAPASGAEAGTEGAPGANPGGGRGAPGPGPGAPRAGPPPPRLPRVATPARPVRPGPPAGPATGSGSLVVVILVGGTGGVQPGLQTGGGTHPAKRRILPRVVDWVRGGHDPS